MNTLVKALSLAIPAATSLGWAPATDGPEQHQPATHASPEKAVPPAVRKSEPAAAVAKVVSDSKDTKELKAQADPEGGLTADNALALLKDGNGRWVSGKPTAPNSDGPRREASAENGQKPFVTIIACSDSRVPVERVFDRGVGDLFVVRVAGNRAGDSEAGTVEYGVEHLKTPLLVVMGHTRCGAVAAAASHAQLHGKVADLVRGIEPAVERARRNNPDADEKSIAAIAVKENVWQTIFDLYRSSDTVREAVACHELKVVGAVYDIASGKVEWLGEHPWQAELLGAINAKAAEATAQAQHD